MKNLSILDSSLISRTNFSELSTIYNLQLIICGNYIQVYTTNSFRHTPKLSSFSDDFVDVIENSLYKSRSSSICFSSSLISPSSFSISKLQHLLVRRCSKPDLEKKISFFNYPNINKRDVLRLIHALACSTVKTSQQKLQLKCISEKNILRSKLNCQRLAKANCSVWKSFITLTFKENITDVSYANKILANYLRSCKRVFNNLKYIAIPEFQSRGAVHYHILTNISCGSDLIPKRQKKRIFNPSSKKYKSLEYYNLSYWDKDKRGFSLAEPVSGDVKKIIGYISKYMTKDIDDRLFSRHRYMYSQNLEKPIVNYLNLESPKDFDYFKRIINGKVLIYDNLYTNSYNDDIIKFEEYYSSI